MITVLPNTDPVTAQATNASLWVRRLFAPGATVVMAEVEYVDTVDCVTRLREAKAAYQRLIMGEAVQVVSHDGRTVTYIPGRENALKIYIRELEKECDLLTNAGRRRMVGRSRPMWWTS